MGRHRVSGQGGPAKKLAQGPADLGGDGGSTKKPWWHLEPMCSPPIHLVTPCKVWTTHGCQGHAIERIRGGASLGPGGIHQSIWLACGTEASAADVGFMASHSAMLQPKQGAAPAQHLDGLWCLRAVNKGGLDGPDV